MGTEPSQSYHITPSLDTKSGIPQKFGVWTRDTIEPNNLKVRFGANGQPSFEIQLCIDPETACIEMLELKDLRDKASEVRKGPRPFCIRNLPEDLSATLTHKFIVEPSVEGANPVHVLSREVNTVYKQAPLCHFENLVDVINDRFADGKETEVFKQLSTLTNASLDIARAYIERCQIQNELTLNEKICFILDGLDAFEENVRTNVVNMLFDLLEKIGKIELGSELLLRSLYKKKHNRNLLVNVFMPPEEQAGEAGHNAPPKLTGLNSKVTSALATELIRPTSHFSCQDRLSFLAFQPRIFLPHERQLIITNLAQEHINAGNLKGFITSLRGLHSLRGDGSPITLHPEIAYESAQSGDATSMKSILDSIQFFDKLDREKLVDLYLSANGPLNVILENLPLLRNLDFSLLEKFLSKSPLYNEDTAHALVEGHPGIHDGNDDFEIHDNMVDFDTLQGHQHPENLVYRNFPSFRATPKQIGSLIKLAFENARAELVIKNLDTIPRRALELLESEYHLLSYQDKIGIPSVRLHAMYVVFKHQGASDKVSAMIEEIDALKKVVISKEPQARDLSEHRFYKEIMRSIFPAHSGRNSFNEIERCLDRSSDLRKFHVRDSYRIDISSGVEMVIKPSMTSDTKAIQTVEGEIEGAQQSFLGHNVKKSDIRNRLAKTLGQSGIELPKTLRSIEERILGVFLENISQSNSQSLVKHLVLGYQFMSAPDIQDYMAYTIDQANRSKNPGYAHLLLMREYLTNNIHEALREILDKALGNITIRPEFVGVYAKATRDDRLLEARELLKRKQASKMGATPNFYDRLLNIFKSSGGSNTPITKQECSSESISPRLRIVSNIIASEQRRIANLEQSVIHKEVNPDSIHLGEFSPEEFICHLEHESSISSDESLACAWIREHFLAVFRNEIEKLDEEIAKYEPSVTITENGEKRRVQVIEGIITKNHTSAHARSTGGVCVGTDNPRSEDPDVECMWDLPNYFQMVLKDPNTGRCEGLVMLHYYKENGKTILTASLNPTSTFLYKVNEVEFLRSLVGAIVEFAKDNQIDFVTCSVIQHIRTNRTGGEFEFALNSLIAKKNKRISLSKPEIFSVRPKYHQEHLDVLWEKGDV